MGKGEKTRNHEAKEIQENDSNTFQLNISQYCMKSDHDTQVWFGRYTAEHHIHKDSTGDKSSSAWVKASTYTLQSYSLLPPMWIIFRNRFVPYAKYATAMHINYQGVGVSL